MLSWPNPHDGSLSWKATLLCDLIPLLKHWRLLVDITCQNCTHGHRIHVLLHIIKYVKMHNHTMKQMMDIHISMIIYVIRFCIFFFSFRFDVMNKEAAADGTRRRPAMPPPAFTDVMRFSEHCISSRDMRPVTSTPAMKSTLCLEVQILGHFGPSNL